MPCLQKRGSHGRGVVVLALASLGVMADPTLRAHPVATATGWEWLAPDVVLTDRERARLDRDEVIVRTIPAPDAQLAVFAAVRTTAAPESLAAWTRRIVDLKRSSTVLAAGQFSDPPDPADVAGLELDKADVDAIRDCRPDDCALKLTKAEIVRLSGAVAEGDGGWRDRVQRLFREVTLDRVREYSVRGLAGVAPAADSRATFSLDESFEAILAGSELMRQTPAVLRWLREGHGADPPGVDSFFYWSKERYSMGKSVVSVTHVGIIRDLAGASMPSVVVVSKQIMSTRYVAGSVGITAILSDSDGRSYLTYMNRARPDLLRGRLGAMVRRAVEDRARREAPAFVRLARTRLESGAPPSDTSQPAR